MDELENSNLLRLIVQRQGDHRLDELLSTILPIYIDHQIHDLLHDQTSNRTSIILRFESIDQLNQAQDYLNEMRTSKILFYSHITDVVRIFRAENWVYANESGSKMAGISNGRTQLIKFMCNDANVKSVVRGHKEKMVAQDKDDSKMQELRNQWEEFEKRRKFLCELIIFSNANLENSSRQIISASSRRQAVEGGAARNSNVVPNAFVLELRKLEAALPIYAKRSEIKRSIGENGVCVIVADTGSGKSTQIPQYILELADDQQDDGTRILCTQPRKVAAVSLAQRVSDEMSVVLGGDEVGYRVGGGAIRCKKNTKLTFTTDTFLLRECLKDALLTKYNCVIVDEAHERSLDTDLALGMLKRCLKSRPTDFRVIIMSATIDPALFIDYFHDPTNDITCGLLTIAGRCYPIDYRWATDESESVKNKCKNHVDLVVQKVKEICSTHNLKNDGGAVLAFLTTPAETELASRELAKENQDDRMWILQLHGRLQADEQKQVFDECPDPKKQRKVVFATNSAETSITIPDVRYVVDCGLVKERRFDAKRNTSSLVVGWTSKSSAKQRAGRAGRTGPGVCYRLYTEDQFEKEMPDRFVAEILRTNMSQTLLYLFALKIDDPLNFDFIERPSIDALKNAHQELIRLDALSVDGQQLTDVGEKMSKLCQVEPRLSRLLIMVADQEKAIIPEACAMVSCISVGNIFYRFGTDEQKNMADVCKTQFCDASGDPITYLQVYSEWSQLRQAEKGRWCAEKFINGKCMKAVGDSLNELRHSVVREAQLAQPEDFNRLLNVDAAKSTLMKCYASCFISNLAMYSGHPRTGYYVPTLKDFVDIHPSSAIRFSPSDKPSQWIVFEYVFETSKKYAFDVASVDESWLTEDLIEKSVLDECKKWAVIRHPLNEFGREIKLKLMRNRASLEQSAAKIYGAQCFIEFAQPKDPFNRLCLYAPERCMEPMVMEIRTMVAPQIKEMKWDFMETPIRQDSSTRVCLGAGGTVQDILMRDEYRTVSVHAVPQSRSTLTEVVDGMNNIPERISSQEMLRWVQKSRIFQADPHAYMIDSWGTIGLDTKDHAKFLVATTQGNTNFKVQARLMFKSPNSASREDGFRILISWCRRPSRGAGILKFKNDDHAPMALMKFLMDRTFRAKCSQRRNEEGVPNPGEIWLGGLALDMDNQRLLDICTNVLSSCEDLLEIERAFVIRKKSFPTSPDDLERFVQELTPVIRLHTGLAANEFALRMEQPRSEADIEYRATLTIADIDQVGKASKLLSATPFSIDDQVVKFVGDAREEITIPARIHHVIKDDLFKLKDHIRINIPTTELKIETLKSGRIVAWINSTQYTFVLHARRLLQDLMRGDVIDCAISPLLAALFKPTGVNFLKELERKHRVYVATNFLRQQIVFYGSDEEIAQAKLGLNQFLDTLDRAGASEAKQIFVQPPAYPTRTLRTILAQNGYSTDAIMAQLSDCMRLKVDPVKRRIDYVGSEVGFRQLEALLRNVAGDLPQVDAGTGDDSDIPDCSACLCPVEPQKNYALETCGHYYCNECILGQLKTATQDKRFPITCVQDGCEKPFVIKDLAAALKLHSEITRTANHQQQNQRQDQAKVDWEPLIDASLEAYLAKNKQEYSHCTTADCHGIYRKTQDSQKFHCELCNTKICSRCGFEFHGGETCESYQAMKRDNNLLDKWYAEDPANRKQCPNCKTPIQKDGGCRHMQCGTCKIHICWRCMKTFNTGPETYDHLAAVCGGIF